MAQLINIAETRGEYDGVPVDASTQLSVELSSLSITKEADKAVWVSGELEYTIVVTNIYVLDPDDPSSGSTVTSVTVTDTIDPEIATLILDSVEINGNPAVAGTDFTYNPETGLLTFTSLDDLDAGDSHTITFRVEKAV